MGDFLAGGLTWLITYLFQTSHACLSWCWLFDSLFISSWDDTKRMAIMRNMMWHIYPLESMLSFVCLIQKRVTLTWTWLYGKAGGRRQQTQCMCAKISIRGKSLRTRPGPWLKKGKGPPPLWQTSAFVLRPMETSNLCLTHRKGQAYPWFPSFWSEDGPFSPCS